MSAEQNFFLSTVIALTLRPVPRSHLLAGREPGLRSSPMRTLALVMLFAVTLAAGWLFVGSLHPAHAFPFVLHVASH
jgi:hypothetical protein